MSLGPAAGAAAWVVERVLPASHPSLAGHFPGQPLFPGVVLLAEVLEAALGIEPLARRLGAAAQIDNVKFLAPLVPEPGEGLIIQIRFSERAQGIDFELHRGERLAARGQLAGAPQG